MDAGYLDHAASTPMRPQAVDAMLPWLRDHAANPSGAHRAARAARKAIDEARDVVAEAVGCRPSEVIFTSGGTEADNLAVFGIAAGIADRSAARCSAIEHHAVLDPIIHLGGATVEVTPDGRLDLDALKASLSPDTRLVSIMAVNNETGVRQPLAEAAELVREIAPQAAVHTDAVQAFQWADPRSLWPHVDLMSLSGHKFGGPKGTGALIARESVELQPLFMGGGQERERRSGTQNVAGIVGFGTAVEIVTAERPEIVDRVAGLKRDLVTRLGEIGGLRFSAPPEVTVPGIVHACIDGIESESLLYLLETRGVFASAASSCASGAMEPSHVLAAMGVSRDQAIGSLRLSLGWSSSHDDVVAAAAAVRDGVAQLRSRA